MGKVQLIVENLNKKGFHNWTMSIYDSNRKRMSAPLRLIKLNSGSCLLIETMLKEKQYHTKLKPFLWELCENETVQVVVRKSEYAHNKTEVERLIDCLKRQKNVSLSDHSIRLFSEGEIIPSWRTVELVLV